jgi:hypothetical protein
MRRIAGFIKACVALPVYLLIEIGRYAGLQDTWLEKIGVFAVMLPIVAAVTVCWAMLWAFALTGLRMLVNP